MSTCHTLPEAQKITYRVPVGQPVQRDTDHSGELRNNAERRDRREVAVCLESPREVFLSRTNAEVVEDDIALCEMVLSWLLLD